MQARAVQNDIARFFWELDNLERHVAVDTFPLHKMPNPFCCRPQSENNYWNQGQFQDGKRQQTHPDRHVTSPRLSRHSTPDGYEPMLGRIFTAKTLSFILSP